jgi:hypothetical protein
MPVAAEDKPLEALRSATVDRLISNYGHGELSLEAFERRLDRALDAKSHEALIALTEDLETFAEEDSARHERKELGLRADPSSTSAAGNVEYMVHAFSGSHRRGQWTVPREIRMLHVFGGAELDFSNARFSAATTRIKMLFLFGGVKLYVPEGVNTVSKAFCFFGGVDNRTASSSDPDAPTLVLEGLLLFGGARVKLKRTLKQRLVEFAETLRGTLAPTRREA